MQEKTFQQGIHFSAIDNKKRTPHKKQHNKRYTKFFFISVYRTIKLAQSGYEYNHSKELQILQQCGLRAKSLLSVLQ